MVDLDNVVKQISIGGFVYPKLLFTDVLISQHSIVTKRLIFYMNKRNIALIILSLEHLSSSSSPSLGLNLEFNGFAAEAPHSKGTPFVKLRFARILYLFIFMPQHIRKACSRYKSDERTLIEYTLHL